MTSASEEARFERISSTGEWWIDPWWRDPECSMKPRCSEDEFSAYVEVLQKHFPAAWLREVWDTKKPNLIVPYL